jgi:hypothetical protein
MRDLIIYNLIFWPIWALVCMMPNWIMQSIIAGRQQPYDKYKVEYRDGDNT